MRATHIRELRSEALYDVFGAIYDEFKGDVFPRLEGKGIVLEGMFSRESRSSPTSFSSTSYPAPLGMILTPENLGINRTPNLSQPHYVRFNTEDCVSLPASRDYAGLDWLIGTFVSETDPEYVEKGRRNVSGWKEWQMKEQRRSA
ncbi:hypothetical protein COV20_06145 [Candidatus Woesearchaeota archaeon CG10_big_fil_rev_8_21_14_0_10_45_16]|nr:MAG: hypothetical protein COV20_06145 [Candidatus Woesearchaeota archaeon CG10_big_fil_rev_8_21_14_0_10_45_16]